MADYPSKYPSSQKGERIESGIDDLARMNINRGIRDSGSKSPHVNPDDTGRYKHPDNRTPERKQEKKEVL